MRFTVCLAALAATLATATSANAQAVSATDQALAKGTVDCAADWWDSDEESNLTRMAAKGMVKKEDFRIVFKSGLLAGSPYAYLSDMPDDLKQAIVKTFMDAPTKDPAAFARLSDGKDKEFVAVTHKDYQDTVDMIQFVNDMRKKHS